MKTKIKVEFHVVIGQKYCRKFEKNNGTSMNGTWEKFNKYANGKGFTIRVEDRKYLGTLAWSNGTEIMELVAAN